MKVKLVSFFSLLNKEQYDTKKIFNVRPFCIYLYLLSVYLSVHLFCQSWVDLPLEYNWPIEAKFGLL